MARYTEMYLASGDELLRCTECGVIVGNTDEHEAWHDRMDLDDLRNWIAGSIAHADSGER